jgi:hypothetical protein
LRSRVFVPFFNKGMAALKSLPKILPSREICFRLGRGRQERIKFSLRVLSLGGMITRVFDPIQYCPLLQKRFQTVKNRFKGRHGLYCVIRKRTSSGDTSL